MNNKHPLTQWVISKIQSEYKEDIALLIAIKGHSINHDGHGEIFDYFIPETERGCELAQTFIIDGIGHDLYPRSWERMEKSADLEEMTILLANAEILYAKSADASDRFHALQQKLITNLNSPAFVYHKALNRLESAASIYRTLLFEEKLYRARSEANRIQLYLSQAVAFMNHTFADSPLYSEAQAYHCDSDTRMYHCPSLNLVPESFFHYAHRLLTADQPEEIKKIVHALIRTTKNFVFAHRPAIKEDNPIVNYENLADWYQELSLTWRRIHYFCRNNMPQEAYIDACYLQEELIVIAQEFQIEELNLLDSFSADSLLGLDLRSRKLEQIIRGILSEHNVKIREYSTMEEFFAAN